jgi:hypothetical protein
MNNELERMRKEAVDASFYVPFRHLLGRTGENHDKPVTEADVWAEVRTKPIQRERERVLRQKNMVMDQFYFSCLSLGSAPTENTVS